jgi:chromate reductase, NAD(P)H dehydrogenase (quinone)
MFGSRHNWMTAVAGGSATPNEIACQGATPMHAWRKRRPAAGTGRHGVPLLSSASTITVLGLSGSLRAASQNTALLRAAARVAPHAVRVQVYPSLGDLPLFNPDLEATDPAPVARLRERIIAADALLIASPEYAHGVTGVIKNALDWMVGNESFVGKPVGLLNTSPRAVHAQAALRETLVTMSAEVVDAACVELPILGSGLDENGVVARREFSQALRSALLAFRAAVTARTVDGQT